MEQKDFKITYLVTGAAGFIGYYLSKKLLEMNHIVIGFDNINDYYDINLKYTRLNNLKKYENFIFVKGDLVDKDLIFDVFQKHKPEIVINLAAQAGVRYSIDNPDIYMQSNVMGFYNILEACKRNPVQHLVFASSSSVYGSNKKVPFEETDFVDYPVSLYAATKKTNELISYTYSSLYKIPSTGLRFFTVYGPLGRPDMAYFDFTNKYFKNEPIYIYNNGDYQNDLYRDFTYIDDIIEGVYLLLNNPPQGDTPYNIYNIGNNHPEKLMTFIDTLEKALSISLGKEVKFDKKFEPIKPGDVTATYASTDKLHEKVGFKPKTSIYEGLCRFAEWYINYYKIN